MIIQLTLKRGILMPIIAQIYRNSARLCSIQILHLHFACLSHLGCKINTNTSFLLRAHECTFVCINHVRWFKIYIFLKNTSICMSNAFLSTGLNFPYSEHTCVRMFGLKWIHILFTQFNLLAIILQEL